MDSFAELILAKQQLKRGVMQRLLMGHAPLNGSVDPWSPARLGAFTQEVRERNARGLDQSFVMGVSKFEGVVPMRERTIGADLDRYKILPLRCVRVQPDAYQHRINRSLVGNQ